MKLFNAFQIVGLFCAMPFLLFWLDSAGFSGHMAAFYAGCAFYLILFGVMVAALYTAFCSWDA